VRMNFTRRLQTFLPEAGGDWAGLSCNIGKFYLVAKMSSFRLCRLTGFL
jgi:hypothetical protein